MSSCQPKTTKSSGPLKYDILKQRKFFPEIKTNQDLNMYLTKLKFIKKIVNEPLKLMCIKFSHQWCCCQIFRSFLLKKHMYKLCNLKMLKHWFALKSNEHRSNEGFKISI